VFHLQKAWHWSCLNGVTAGTGFGKAVCTERIRLLPAGVTYFCRLVHRCRIQDRQCTNTAMSHKGYGKRNIRHQWSRQQASGWTKDGQIRRIPRVRKLPINPKFSGLFQQAFHQLPVLFLSVIDVGITSVLRKSGRSGRSFVVPH